MKSILILGSEGFIGSHVVQAALRKGYRVQGIDIADRSPSRYQYEKLSIASSDMESFLKGKNYDMVINCAGSGNVGFSVQHPLGDFDFNTRSVMFVLEAIRKHLPGVQYVHLSSAAVYGNPSQLPVDEGHPIRPVSPYGYHKWLSEIICGEYAALYHLRISVVRPFSVYGPGLQKQLLWDVFQRSRHTNEVTLWGTGEETRDFIFVEDAATALLVIGDKTGDHLETYNLASGVSISVKEVVQQLFSALGWERVINCNQEIREGDPRFWQADITKLQGIGFRPSFCLKEGLLQTAAWMKGMENSL
ncbi:MAG TPA: NAD-dependent epimerase/dehydratase family protein [Lacibacter sp.]|nr:NAD-dependent epimerase/dehydratase family protein [Lacibacter sp.]HMO88664.1 NAD-dependent epimerase/dehydratase family protein [Lacibacter sp.]